MKIAGRSMHLLPAINFLRNGDRSLVCKEELVRLSWKAREDARPPVFEAIYPSGTVPISVTGSGCSLQCPHCGGKYLQHMMPVDMLSAVLAKDDVKSILLSGGCTEDGQVPLAPKLQFVSDEIAKTSRNIRVNAHPGVATEKDALHIANFASTISYDFVLDDVTIKECFGFNLRGQDYVNTLRNLQKGTAKVVPHILVGLYKGEIRGEYDAVKVLSQEGIREIIFIVFIPTPGTPWENLSPPNVDSVLRLLAWTRILQPAMKITLGCMRPHGGYREKLDLGAINLGVDGIVLPHRNALREAEKMGLKIVKKRECCAFD